jgi:hypothetical protein
MAGDQEELESLRSRVASLEAMREQAESENNRLASLFVAAYQLHSTLELREVVQIITEILLNLVGARSFAIYLVDDDGVLDPVAVEGAGERVAPRRPVGAAGGVIGACFAARAPHYEPGPSAARAVDEDPIVAVPLRLASARGVEVVGVLAVWEFLEQKRELVDVDMEIFNLLGQSAANALEAALIAHEAAAGTGRARLSARSLREALP